jgi:hypothetical protein
MGGTGRAWGQGRAAFHAAMALIALAVYARAVPADVGLYQHYAHAFLRHGTFPVEYPPLSLLPMLLPLALPVPYALGQGLFAALLWALLAAELGEPLIWLGIVPFATVALGTYDVWPIAAMVWAYRTFDRRPGLGWGLLGLALALKLFPALLVPLFWARRRRGWPWLLPPLVTLAPPLIVSVVHYQLARQAEWESTVSLLSWLLAPGAMHRVYAFQSVEFDNRWSSFIGWALLVLFAAGAVLVVRSRRRTLAEKAVLLFSGFFLADKVLSSQYVLWAFVWALLAGEPPLLWVGLLWLTALLYPWLSALLPRATGTPPMPLLEGAVAVRQLFWALLLLRLGRRRGLPRALEDVVDG